MKLFIIEPKIRIRDYDTSRGFVVRAVTEEQARLIASKNHGDEVYDYHDFWLDNKASSCAELLPEGESELILRDFHAG